MNPGPQQDTIDVGTSPWVDLVFHTLARIPVSRRDASRLYGDEYESWVRANMPETANAHLATLPADASLLAKLYDGSDQAFGLHAFATMYTDIPTFMSQVSVSLEEAELGIGGRKVADRLSETLSPELLELFRIAVWGEVQAGYRELRDGVVQGLYDRYLASLSAGLTALAPRLPGLSSVQWLCCHPLRRAGRVLRWPEDDSVTILVGCADPGLGVPQWAPVLQACHEYLVHRVVHAARGVGQGTLATRRGAKGYGRHMALETVALALGASVMRDSDLEAEHEQWLLHLFPGGRESMDPVRSDLRGVFEELQAEFSRTPQSGPAHI